MGIAKRRASKFASQIILIILDLVLLSASFYIGYILRVRFFPTRYYPLPPALPIGYYSKYIFAFLIWIITFYYEGVYSKNLTKSEEFIKIAKSTTIASAFAALLFYTIKVEPSYSRLAFLISYFISTILLWIGHVLLKRLLFDLGLLREKAILWGNSSDLEWLKRTIEKEKTSGIEIAEHITSEDSKIVEEKIKDVNPALIIVAGIHIDMVKKIEPLAWERGIEILINTFNHSLNPQELEIVEFFGFKSLKLKYNLLIPRNAYLKRTLDLLVSIPLLLISLPLIIVIGIIILLTSKGPVFYMQERVGKDGKTFKMYKFRTMYKNSQEILNRLLSEKPQLKEEYDKYRKIVSVKDPRVTPIGRLLRRTSLDELPQIFNIIKGEMSLVGPRPYMPEELEIIKEYKDIILSVKPGLTGLWQVSGRNKLSFEERMKLDIYYVKNWDIFLDIAIFIKTILELLKGEGAY